MKCTIGTHEFDVRTNGKWSSMEDDPTRWLDVDFVAVDGKAYGIGIISECLEAHLDESGNRLNKGERYTDCCDRRYPDTDDFMKLVCGTTNPDDEAWTLAECLVSAILDKFDHERWDDEH